MRLIIRSFVTCLVSCAILFACSAVPDKGAQDRGAKVDDVMSKLKSHLYEKCGSDYGTLLTSKVGSLNYSMAEDAIYMECNCIPEKLPALERDLKDATLNSDEELMGLFEEKFRGITIRCGAERFRTKVASLCESGELFKQDKTNNKEKECGCVVAGLDELSDEEIVTSSVQAYKKFRGGVEVGGGSESGNVVDETLSRCQGLK